MTSLDSSSAGQHQSISNKKQLLIAAILILVTGVAYFLQLRFWPVNELGDLRLGMSEVDATLHFARKADVSTLSKSGDTKELTFFGGPGYFNELRLRKSGKSFKVYEICSNTSPPESKGIHRFAQEKDVVRKLGNPSYVSVSQDGTVKISSFGSTNLAFMFERGMIREFCVSDSLPIQFENEYGS